MYFCSLKSIKMAKTKKNQKGEKNIVAVEEALGKSEQFIEKNQQTIIYTVAVIVILIAGYIGYTRFVLEPREKEARSEMFMAEKYFADRNFDLALNGDGEYPGFIDILSNYNRTKSANLSRYYAGISLIQTGELEEGIRHLKRFSGRDELLGSMAYGAIADAYWELGSLQEAARFYRRAYRENPNDFTTPAFLFKAGLLYEEMGEFGEAIERYQRIKKDYPTSDEGRDIEKYIARAEAMK